MIDRIKSDISGEERAYVGQIAIFSSAQSIRVRPPDNRADVRHAIENAIGPMNFSVSINRLILNIMYYRHLYIFNYHQQFINYNTTTNSKQEKLVDDFY